MFSGTLFTHALAFLLGAGGGAWAWGKYKAKVAADLLKVSQSAGK